MKRVITTESRCDMCNGRVVTRNVRLLFRFGYQITRCYGEERAYLHIGSFKNWPPAAEDF